MKRSIIVLVSLLMVIVFVTAAHAGSSKTRQITGNVTAIDTKTNTVTVKKKNRQVVLGVEEKTEIIQCTRKTSIADIKVGDKVTAKYKETADKNAAKSITVRESSERTD